MIQWTRSPIDTIATTFVPSTTGRWRQRLSVMYCMHSSTVLFSPTVWTLLDMTSRTFISFEERPTRTTLRA
jgi:hypothetical protein